MSWFHSTESYDTRSNSGISYGEPEVTVHFPGDSAPSTPSGSGFDTPENYRTYCSSEKTR